MDSTTHSLDYVFGLLKDATSAKTGGSSGDRLQAALLWVRTAEKWSDSTSVQAYRTTFEVLENLLASGRSLESRHLRLGYSEAEGTRNIAVEGTARAISLGNIELALELLEQGRSVLLTQAGRYRTQVDDLETVLPRLAHKFRMISTEMEASTMRTGQQEPFETTDDVVASCVPTDHREYSFD